MAYSTVAARLPEEDEAGLKFVMKYEKIDKSAAARKLIELGLAEWKKSEALRLLSEGRLTFSAAAKFAGVSVWEFVALVESKKASWIQLSDLDLESDLKALT